MSDNRILPRCSEVAGELLKDLCNHRAQRQVNQVPPGIGAFLYSKNINLLLTINPGIKNKGHRGSGDLLISNQKREKRELSRERGINGLVRERLVGLCRESPFTASGSEATFAVTDGQLNQVNSHRPAEKTNAPTTLQKQN